MERQANEIAAELVFQGNRFTEEALDSPTSVTTVTDLAPKYGASYESAIRRYAERHVLPCAVIVFDKVHKDVEDSESEDSEYRIHYTVTSPVFRKNYYSAVEIKGGTLKGRELCDKARWRGAKLQLLRRQPLVASHAADEHERFLVSGKMLAKAVKPSNHCGSLSIRNLISF
jgi:hypothetical protein